MSFNKVDNTYKHFTIRLVDKGCKELEALRVSDAFSDRHKIFLKDKKAVRDLIAQLMMHMEDLSEDQS